MVIKSILVLCLQLVVYSGLCAQQFEKLEKFLEKRPLKEVEQQAFAQKGLTARKIREAEKVLYEAWKKEIKNKYHTAWETKCFTLKNLRMQFAYGVFGECPEEGRSLYISMHGGGNAPETLNTQQWRNQLYLYQPAEGVYLAPRAPWDDWNMWFKSGLDEFFEMLIQAAVVEMGVNPNKVYLLGYSAGGDGVWRMAPRMADRWAAASMMAGHPGEASQVNLRNVPFMIWMGEQDGAYDRNRLAAEKGKGLDALRREDPKGYVHETHIIPGKGHWMDRADTAAIGWMAQYTRNPLPAKVVWRQENVVRPSLYWLETDPETAREGMMVRAEIRGNEVAVLTCDYPKLRIYLNDDLVDLDKPVKVTYQGRVLFDQKVKRTLGTLAATLASRGDKELVFSGYMDVEINK